MSLINWRSLLPILRQRVIWRESLLRVCAGTLGVGSSGFANDAVSRAYYAAFHWARALLLTKGLEPKTHRGVVQLIGLHFVKAGIISEEVSAHLAHLETFRELSDYNCGAEFDAGQARREIERARQFIECCKPLLPRKGRGRS